ncbi:hypothetical protein NDU88_000159 [Pleurodeles waltl]|uniref:Uncharacterized protein n=1 Tax=Pleurodeles waltl TaxID=8319 RepID=A0AAV7S593_PLEWA|nr:hypothetical protein NDU88_000159 [Pleurodeles waltl]
MRERKKRKNREQTALQCCTRSVSLGDRVNSRSSARRAQQLFLSCVAGGDSIPQQRDRERARDAPDARIAE